MTYGDVVCLKCFREKRREGHTVAGALAYARSCGYRRPDLVWCDD